MSWEEVDARREARQKHEWDTAKSIVDNLDKIDHDKALSYVKSVLNHFHADVVNQERRDVANEISKALQERGVTYDVEHYTGDNSYPTEYTLTYNSVRGSGPTFDMALTDFVVKLLKIQTPRLNSANE